MPSILVKIGSLLAKPLAVVGQWLLPFLFDWLTGAVKKWWAQREAKQKIEQENQKVREQTERAETPKEREDAAQNTINHW